MLVGGIGILINGNVLVHRSVTSFLTVNDSMALIDGLPLLVSTPADDPKESGNLFRELTVITNGIIKYKENERTSHCHTQPESDSEIIFNMKDKETHKTSSSFGQIDLLSYVPTQGMEITTSGKEYVL
ncbi:MAG: hypothetical protein LUE93_13405 [Bacteroides sp.]|nr:hypothetical protein [Bacteroides sp.]